MARPEEPSGKNVIRFIAVPGNPDSDVLPYGSFVVGYGYGTSSGKQHRDLAKLYKLDQEEEGLYAGYLYLGDDGKVKFFSGGSGSLIITPSAEKDKEVEMTLKECGAFARILGNLFPLITAGTVPNLTVAVFW